MNQWSWDRVKSLLADAAALPSAEREQFVIEHCPDPEVRREVLELLASPASLTGIVTGTALEPGARLGPYVIDQLIGRGGMGEVYKATDSSLKRSVAIKVLPASLDGDLERQARLRREARLLAALNHPNIAHIHGFEESTGVAALVMELVDGPTLADRLQKPMPLTEVLTTARQIADGLEAAHAQGIIHRDLKPANIKVREDGTVKILDFGLARTLDLSAASSAATFTAPGTSFSATQPGLIVGTAAYMAPEQALGKAVDKRADVWSFGCVLYEMLAGKRAFSGSDVSDTLARIIGSDPDWTALPPKTPAPLLRLLRRCLEKSVNKRLADIADARLDIEEASLPASTNAASVGAPIYSRRFARTLPWVLTAASITALGIVLAVSLPWRKASPLHQMHLRVDLGVGDQALQPVMSYIAISPDGENIAFPASKGPDPISRLYIRSLDRLDAVPLPGTDHAVNPFFSPDGQWIAFFAEGMLKKIAVTGGSAVRLCDAPNGRGGAWGEDGTIVFSPDQKTGLSRVSEIGGTPQPITTLEPDEQAQRWPEILPGGKAVLYSSLSPTGSGFNFAEGNLVVQLIPAGARKIVKRGATYGRYVPSGHVLYLRDKKIYAAPFDLGRLEFTGPERLLTDSVISNSLQGSAMFAVSRSGTFVSVRPFLAPDLRPITWLDRAGRSSVLSATPSAWSEFAFDPDGKRLAVRAYDGQQFDIWVNDLSRGVLEPLTHFNAGSGGPAWTPDGHRVAFSSMLGEKEVGPTYNLYWIPVDGSGPFERLTTSPNLQSTGSWHPNGRILAFTEQRSRATVMLLQLEGDDRSGWKFGNPTVFFHDDFDQRAPSFSPKGDWLAYESNRTGQYNVYVRPFPGPGLQVPISTAGGIFPTWSQKGSELIYQAHDGQVMIVSYSVKGGSFHAERPRPWPEAKVTTARGRGFALHPDGKRLVLPSAAVGPPAKWEHLELRLNLFDELRRVAPPQAR